MNKKSIWILSHYSADPRYNTGYRYYNWAKELVSRGYEVYIFCASTIHNTDINIIETNQKYLINDYENIHYVYVKCSDYSGNGIKRILNMLEFSFNLNKVYKKIGVPDIVLGRLPHVWCGNVAYKISRRYNTPLILDIADLWPEGFVEHLNISKNNILIKYYNYLEHRMYKRANALIFSMAGCKELLKDKKWNDIDINKVFHINMGVDLKQFDFNKENYTYTYPELENKDLFKVTYCGSIRLINHVQILCDAAKILRDRNIDNVFFSIHGFGDKEKELKKYCEDNALTNIKFYGKIDKKNIPYVLSHSDVNVLSYHETPLYKYGGSMSKMFEAFASGKPVLSNVHMGYSLIDEYKCGLVSDKNNGEEIAETIIKFMSYDKDKLDEMGKAARRCAEDYDQPQLVDKLEEVINFVV